MSQTTRYVATLKGVIKTMMNWCKLRLAQTSTLIKGTQVITLTIMLTGLALMSLMSIPSTSASAVVCAGSIPKEYGTNGRTYPYSYFVSRTIDGDGSDEEYVFRFALQYAVEHSRLRWYTNSWRIRSVADWRWNGYLYSPQSCASPTLVYADKQAVDATGGPEFWKREIWLWRR
jgi:hypothetical protein